MIKEVDDNQVYETLFRSYKECDEKNKRLKEENAKLKIGLDLQRDKQDKTYEGLYKIQSGLYEVLKEENARMREALEWYGDEKRYYWEPIFGPGEIDFDKGE